MLNNIRISVKLPLLVFLSATISCFIIGITSYTIAYEAMEDKAHEELGAILTSRTKALETYLSSINSDITFVSKNKEVIHALREFKEAWRMLPLERGEGINQKDYLQHYYINENPNP